MDAEGYCNELEGGCIGRVIAIVGTSENQKKRDEHIHFQAVVECLHTSSTLDDIAQKLEDVSQSLLHHYKNYVDASCLQSYTTSEKSNEELYDTWQQSASFMTYPLSERYV